MNSSVIFTILLAMMLILIVAVTIVYYLYSKYYMLCMKLEEQKKEVELRLKENRKYIIKSTIPVKGIKKITQKVKNNAKKKDMWLSFQDSEALNYIHVDNENGEASIYVIDCSVSHE